AIALSDLDRAADDAVTTAGDVLAAALARLADAAAADQQRVDELAAEQARLEDAHDPDPTPPAWVTDSDGTALWRCLDFTEHVSVEHRAGIEAALLASGLLTATVDTDGSLTAADGQLLVSPVGEGAPASLTNVLTVDPASPLPKEPVTAVRQAARSGAKATQLRREADELARAWAARDREHRQACLQFGLPVDEESLRDLHSRAERAVAGCAAMTLGAGTVDKAMKRYAATVVAIHAVTQRRAGAESTAAGEWREWRT